MQRHHLLPRQLVGQPCFRAFVDAIGRDRLGFDDFRINGLLLPCDEAVASQVGLPLHRGPHRAYNQLVAERFGQIEWAWANRRLRAPEIALDEALMRIDLLQSALRKRLLLSRHKPIRLNQRDRLGQGLDFSELDAMAEALWAGTA